MNPYRKHSHVFQQAVTIVVRTLDHIHGEPVWQAHSGSATGETSKFVSGRCNADAGIGSLIEKYGSELGAGPRFQRHNRCGCISCINAQPDDELSIVPTTKSSLKRRIPASFDSSSLPEHSIVPESGGTLGESVKPDKTKFLPTRHLGVRCVLKSEACVLKLRIRVFEFSNG